MLYLIHVPQYPVAHYGGHGRSMMRIVVVEDERNLAELIELYLARAGFEVEVFADSDGVIDYIDSHDVDLAILDIMLPGEKDGYQLCSAIRESHSFPIIMLTAKVQQDERIEGFTVGADDYVTKPFFPMELVARVKAQLRRTRIYSRGMTESLLGYGGVILNEHNSAMSFGDSEVSLTPTEFSILRHMMESPHMTHSTQEIFESVWDEPWLEQSANTVMVHIRHIRKKLDNLGAPEDMIRTIWGVGYRIGS